MQKWFTQIANHFSRLGKTFDNDAKCYNFEIFEQNMAAKGNDYHRVSKPCNHVYGGSF